MSARLTFLTLLALAFAAIAAASPNAEPKHTLVFFGDSLTAGYGLADPETQSYPARIGERIRASKLDWKVVNAGLSGETTAGGLRRIDWVLRQKIDVLVIALGGNDGLRGIAPAVSRGNLQGIIDHVRAAQPSAIIVLAGMRMPESMGEDYAGQFRAIYANIAAGNHVVLVPFLLEGVGGHPDLNQADMIHPNSEGAQLVADHLWPYLEPLLKS